VLDIVKCKHMSTVLFFFFFALPFHEAVKYELIRSLNNWPSYEHTNLRARAHAHTHTHTVYRIQAEILWRTVAWY